MSDQTPAQELRAAAEKARAGTYLLGPGLHVAVAALLTEVADSVEQDGGVIEDSTSYAALAVARALLGGDQ
jgi:hypothetical protein